MKRRAMVIALVSASCLLMLSSCGFSGRMRQSAILYALEDPTGSNEVVATLKPGDAVEIVECIDTKSDLLMLVRSDVRRGYLYDMSRVDYDPIFRRPSVASLTNSLTDPISALNCLATVSRLR